MLSWLNCTQRLFIHHSPYFAPLDSQSNQWCILTIWSKLSPSEVVTIGILFALKGGHFRAFYRWLSRDYGLLFGGLPDRTTLQR